MRLCRPITVFFICILPFLFSACGGQRERNADIPTKEEAKAAVEKEFGIKGVSVLDVEDVRGKGADYHEIDAVYTMTSDRGVTFTVLRACSNDTLFGTGYHYSWITDYGDAVMEDYLKGHSLPEGVSFSDEEDGRFNYGARAYFGNVSKKLRFEFTSDTEFEDHLDALEPWLDDWYSFEEPYFSEGKAPKVIVFALRPQDESMKYPIQVYRVFGYEEDSFHMLGEDGETYRPGSFRKAMREGYEAQKKLKMK